MEVERGRNGAGFLFGIMKEVSEWAVVVAGQH